MKIKRDDTVKIIMGDDRGKTGRVLEVDPTSGTLIVEGVNMVWEHVRRSQKHPKGGRIQREAEIAASKVMVVCQSCDKPTRVKYGIPGDAAAPRPDEKRSRLKVRLCRKCGKPVRTEE